jgi:hypothetical protein
VTLVSSQKISSASNRASKDLFEISSRFPIGVGTKHNIAINYFAILYLALNFSTLPAASTNFCSPVKNG